MGAHHFFDSPETYTLTATSQAYRAFCVVYRGCPPTLAPVAVPAPSVGGSQGVMAVGTGSGLQMEPVTVSYYFQPNTYTEQGTFGNTIIEDYSKCFATSVNSNVSSRHTGLQTRPAS